MNHPSPAGARRASLPVSLLLGLVAALIAWSPVLAAVSWGTVYRATGDHTYTNGNALGRTVTSGGTPKLHEVYSQYVVGGVHVTNTGPYLGVYYRRGNGTGSSWGTPKRLNSTSKHGDFGTLDTSGKYVYVAWRRQPNANSTWNGVDPRPLQFRRNTNHGSADYWKAQPSFVGADRIDRPSVAATGARVWIAYTDAVGGEIRLQKSTDYGKTFTYVGAVGATTALLEGGYWGRPYVAATGSTIAVVWDTGSSTWIKISTDAGATWAVNQELDDVSFNRLDVDATSGRVVVAWTDGAQPNLYLRRWNGSSLGATKTIVALSDASTYKRLSLPAVALTGTSVIGVAYTACSASDCSVGSTKGLAVRWIESRDAGKTWSSNKTVGSYTASSSRRVNEYPSAVWGGSSRRIVLWQAFSASGATDRLVVRSGTGTP
jgi:hypothetical protein